MPEENSISIVIRTFNSAKTLGQVFAGMRLEKGDEFIIVDSGSTDATLEIANKHGAKIVIAPKPFHYSKSLNLGFRATINPWVLVMSSHCIPVVEDFLGIHRREIATFAPDVVVGFAPSTLSGASDPSLDREKTTFYSKDDYEKVCGICANSNTIYRRSAWDELPFDETVRTAEDKLWIMEMSRRGYRFAYIPTARGVNRNQASLIYMFNKGYRDARSLRKSPYKPMSLWHLGGAWKNLAKQRIRGEIDSGNWVRCSVHALGQFLGTHRSEDNTPRGGAS